MQKFEFYNPVKVIFGPGEMNRLGTEAARYGKAALLVKAEGPLEKLGVYARATRLLQDAGLTVCSLEGVTANPKMKSVREGIRICRDNAVDVVIAVGGGSAIDCAKAVAMGAVDEVDGGDVWDFFTRARTASKALPIGAVSTIAATGAEMSLHCVITNEDTQQKYATHYDFTFPKFSIIDPELHTTVPRFLTACGLCDTITHVAENYFAGDRSTLLTDRIAEGVVRTVLDSESILNDLTNVDLRGNLAWAATIGINGLTDCGRGVFDYGAHTIEHALGGNFDIVHGAGLAAVHPAWLAYVCDRDPSKFATFGERVFGLDRAALGEERAGKATVEMLKAKYRSWGLPTTLSELKIDAACFPKIAADVVADPDSPIKDPAVVIDVLSRCA